MSDFRPIETAPPRGLGARSVTLLVLLAWGLHRLATADGTERPRRRAAASSAPARPAQPAGAA